MRERWPTSIVISGLAALSLAACGPSAKKSESAETPPSSAPPLAASAATLGANASAPAAAIDPEHDTRPDRVKFDEFNARLQAQQDDLVANDADFVQSMRAAFQKGSQDGAKTALVAYANQIQMLLASEPPLPKLDGCFARASGPAGDAREAATATLTARRDKVQALSAITYRPLSLPDFASAVTDPAAGQQQAAQIKATLAKAGAAITGCGSGGSNGSSGGGGTRHSGAQAHEGQSAGAASAASDLAAAPSPQPQPATASPPAARPDQSAASSAPARKPTFMERLRHAFQK